MLLQEQLAANRLVLFLGADMPAELTGLPSRAELANGLAQYYQLPTAPSLAATAQRVMQAGNRFAFTDYLIRRLDTSGRTPQAFHQLLAQLPLPTIVTTAYDNLLELALQQAGRALNRVVRASDLAFIDPRRLTLIKLYGDLQQRDTLVVTEDDHYGLWRNPEKEGLLDEVRRAMRGNAVLFLGYNLADPDFRLLWQEVLERMGRFALGAYAVNPEMPADEREVWAERMVRIIDSDPLALLAALGEVPEPAIQNAAAPDSFAGKAQHPGGSPVSLIDQTRVAELVLWLRQRADTGYEALVTLRLPDSAVDDHLIEGEPPIVNLDPFLLLPDTSDIETYGNTLRRILFADLRLSFAIVRAQERALGAGIPLRFRLQLDADDPALNSIRWELLQDPQHGHFLCTREQVRFSRYLSGAGSMSLSSERALTGSRTALIAVANPVDIQDYGLAPLDEQAQLKQATVALKGYKVTPLPQASFSTLIDELRTGPAILYLIAHGSQLDDGNTGVYLADADGKAMVIPAYRFASAIAGLASRPRLIVLAACQSAGQTGLPENNLIALAPQLAQAGVGAVIAMNDNVSVSTVTAGMPIVFDELRQHGSIDQAVAAMRNVLATRGDDWWQIVLYLRLRDGQLWRKNSL